MKKLSVSLIACIILTALLCYQCSVRDGKVTLDIAAKPFEKLSDYHFFKGKLADLLPNSGLLP